MIINFNNKQINQIYYDDQGALKVDTAYPGGVSSTTVANDSEKQQKTVIAIVDEQIKLYDGKFLKRIRDNLIVE